MAQVKRGKRGTIAAALSGDFNTSAKGDTPSFPHAFARGVAVIELYRQASASKWQGCLRAFESLRRKLSCQFDLFRADALARQAGVAAGPSQTVHRDGYRRCVAANVRLAQVASQIRAANMNKPASKFLRFGAAGPFVFPYRVPRARDIDAAGHVLVWCTHAPSCWTLIAAASLVAGEIWKPAPRPPPAAVLRLAEELRAKVKTWVREADA